MSGKSKYDGEDDGQDCACCCGTTCKSWKALFNDYLGLLASISAGFAGAGWGSTSGSSSSGDAPAPAPSPLPPSPDFGNFNSTCVNPLEEAFTPIVSTYYAVIGAMMAAQIAFLFMRGSDYKDSRVDMYFTAGRMFLTILTTISFIVGWAVSVACTALNPFAMATSLVSATQTVMGQYEKVMKLIKELKDGDGSGGGGGAKGDDDSYKSATA